MRIVLVHSFYESQHPSGENRAVEAELTALRRAGHDAELVSVRTDDASHQVLYKARAGMRVASGRGRNPLDALEQLRPDVVHVHNTFPNYGRRWAQAVDVPLVHTLHNFRPLCAAGTLFRDGAVCTLCPDGAPWSGTRYGCYRGSRFATLPLSFANRRGPSADPLIVRADRLIVLSEQARRLYEAAGVPHAKLTVWPGFLPDHLDPGADGHREDRWLFVGRLSQEKGILELVRRWPAGERLLIVGDGPLRSRVEQAAPPSVALLGNVPRQRVLELMRSSIALVFPSLCFENSPLVYVESIAAGLPVLAAHPNVVAELVTRERTGVALKWESELADQLNRMRELAQDIRPRCRARFEATYSERAHVDRAVGLYTSLTDDPSSLRSAATTADTPVSG